jgi:muramoyltetrapeptide carboxypeptidase
MILPSPLQEQDEIRIVSTARKISSESIEKAVKIVDRQGFKASVGRNAMASYHQFAGTTEERVKDLQDALDDDSVKAIWCSRGGYGTVKLLDQLDFSRFVQNPKWIIGYSDVTALLMHIYSQFGICSVHGTMPINAASLEASHPTVQSLFNVLRGRSAQYALKEHPFSSKQNFEGTLVGGNLSMLYSILGSSSFDIPQGSVLLLEDLDEYLYHVDRMFMNIKRNGVLDKLNGVLVGGLTDMNDNTIPYGQTAEEIALSYFQEMRIPVVFGFPSGHIENNLSVIIGKRCQVVDGLFVN